MSLYHLTVKIVGRSKGMDATAAAAYITRSKVYDRTTGETFDHTHHKDKAIWAGRFLPEEHPAWAEVGTDKNGNPDFGELWNLVEENEKRKDSQFARNFNIAAQDEFTDEENLECFNQLVSRFFTKRRIIADGAFHEPHVEEDGTANKNKHFHLLTCIRQVNENGWEAKKDREANDKKFLEEMRSAWAEINNAMFDKKFRAAHAEEYKEIEDKLQDSIPDAEQREREATEYLYDRYPEEWKHISEKTLDEQREELDMLLDAEEEKEIPNWDRIRRYEKYFLSVPMEAQKHRGPKKDSPQNENDRFAKNTELEEKLSEVTVSEDEITESLENDEEYNELIELKNKIIQEATENIEDAEEVKSIREQLEKIKTTEQMDEWMKNVWTPIRTEIYRETENGVIFEDVKSENSEVIETLNTADTSEFPDDKLELIEDRKKSLSQFIDDDMNEDYLPTQYQRDEMTETAKDLSVLQSISEKIKNTWQKIQGKVKEIIQNSPLRKFRIFRAQQELVDSWTPIEIQTAEKTEHPENQETKSRIEDIKARAESATRHFTEDDFKSMEDEEKSYKARKQFLGALNNKNLIKWNREIWPDEKKSWEAKSIVYAIQSDFDGTRNVKFKIELESPAQSLRLSEAISAIRPEYDTDEKGDIKPIFDISTKAEEAAKKIIDISDENTERMAPFMAFLKPKMDFFLDKDRLGAAWRGIKRAVLEKVKEHNAKLAAEKEQQQTPEQQQTERKGGRKGRGGYSGYGDD